MNLFNMVSFRKEKAAFTLAEVLITIGIIGVVAALPLLSGIKLGVIWSNMMLMVKLRV